MRHPKRTGPLKIGDVARQSGVAVETLRFYETQGLIEPIGRTEAGYRLYDRSVFERLSFIKKAQAVGFSLGEIGWIVSEAAQGRRPCREVRVMARHRLAELEGRLSELKRYRDELEETIDAWDRQGQKDGFICGLIEGLQPGTIHPPETRSRAIPPKTRRTRRA